MYVPILILFPLLLMFNPYLVMGALAVAIIGFWATNLRSRFSRRMPAVAA